MNNDVQKYGFLPVGKIVGSHGVKGNLKVRSYAESLTVFKPGKLILVIQAGQIERKYSINWAKPHGKFLLLSLKGIENRNAGDSLVGNDLFIERAELPELEEGSYYWADIIGLSVFSIDDQYIGRVESIIPTGGNDVYVVKNQNKNDNHEILIPAIESVVLEMDFKNKIMRVALPEGL
ncbi:MAG: ribosome maturation factor RimM [Desulfobacterales bacterium]